MRKYLNIKSFPFFYGYIILFSGTIGVLMSSPGQTIGISVFTDYLVRDLGISREALSFAYMIGTFGSAFILTNAGKFFDKFGARITSVIAAILMGISLLFLSQIGIIGNLFNSIFSGMSNSAIIFILLVFGFFAVRFSGQGVLTMSSKNMVMKWFDKRRGLASAIMGISISFGFSYSPRIFDALISNLGWRETWLLLAFVSGIIFAAFAFLTFRDNPAAFGLIPDGKEIIHKTKKKQVFTSEKDYTLPEARSTFSFWIYNLTLSMQALYGTAITFHIADVFLSAGMDRETAISIFLPMSVVAVIVQLISGYIADYIKMKYLLLAEIAGMMLSMAGLFILESGLPVYMIIVGSGIASGLFGVVSIVTWPRYYGTKHLGSITGFNMAWIVAGSAVGPYMFSLIKEYSGSYHFPGLILLVVTFVLFIMGFKTDNKNLKAGTGIK